MIFVEYSPGPHGNGGILAIFLFKWTRKEKHVSFRNKSNWCDWNSEHTGIVR
jgi:hypothetical protein